MKTQILLIAMISLSVQALTATNFCYCAEFVTSEDCNKRNCTWSSTDSTCAAKTFDCTTYTTQSSCDNNYKCTWSDATSKCTNFTVCADYTVTAAEQCKQKNYTCVAGTAGTDGKFQCETESITCSRYTNAQDCNGKLPSYTTMCWFIANACAQFDVSKCSVVTEKGICDTAGDCKWTTDSKCAAYTCADIPTADSCVVVELDDFSGINICSWNTSTSKCADASDVSTLTSSNCLDKTFGYYHWDGGSCQECLGSISKTALKPCDCTKINQFAVCKGRCTWSSTDSTCVAKTIDCTTYITQSMCDEQFSCAWNDKTSKCAIFTACANYIVTVADQCYQKNDTCVPGTTGTDGKIPCKTGSITCSSYMNSADCNFKSPSDTTMCRFKDNTCLQINISKCSVVTVKEKCEQSMCKWTTDKKCTAYTCADIPTADSCVAVALDDFSGVNICSWNTSTSKCTDAADSSTLKSSNCFDKTFGFYFKDGSASSENTGSSSNGYILAFIGFIVMFMF